MQGCENYTQCDEDIIFIGIYFHFVQNKIKTEIEVVKSEGSNPMN